MPRYSVSVSNEQDLWLKKNPQVSPSGLFQKALKIEMAGRAVDNRKRFREELENRIKSLKLERRIKVLVHDVKFPIVDPYPWDRNRDLVNFIKEKYDKELETIKDKGLGPVYFNLNVSTANAFASIEYLLDDYSDPIVIFESQLL